jgi:hypothetical protein
MFLISLMHSHTTGYVSFSIGLDVIYTYGHLHIYNFFTNMSKTAIFPQNKENRRYSDRHKLIIMYRPKS